MTLASALPAYAALNAGLMVAVLGLAVIETSARRLGAAHLLSMHYAAAVAVILGALICALIPAGLFIDPGAWFPWSAERLFLDEVAPHTIAMPGFDPITPFSDAGSAGRAWIATALALLVLGILRLARDCLSLHRLLGASQCIRQQGRVRVWIHDGIAAPFSCWLPNAAHVVVPAWIVERPDEFRMVLAHELQHHRQRDTLWLYAFWILRWFCALNPFVHWWSRRLSRVQEYSCDEAMAGQSRWTAAAYARCLLDVAARGVHDPSRQRCTTPFIRFGDPHVLIRRIEKMLNTRKASGSAGWRTAGVTSVLVAVAASAYVASAMAQPDIPAPARDAGTRSSAGGEHAFAWPLVNGQVVAGFAGKHHGLDIAAEAGTEVLAYATGLVIARGAARGCGLHVQIRHAGNATSRYCNLADVRVKPGDRVAAGDRIGVIAAAPEGQKAHLHFELKLGDEKVDPLEHLPRKSG